MNYLIAISGGSGAGKTTLSNRLKEIFQDDLVQVTYDSYCVDRSGLTMEERTKVNYDHPTSYDSELFAKQIKALKNGESIDRPTFDFATHTRTKETVKIHPKKIIVIEGILVLQVKELLDEIDLSIFVDADADLRLARRLLRDIKERGRTPESVVAQYLSTVKPSHYDFIEPSKYDCNIVFNNNKNDGLDEKQVEKIVKLIKKAV